MKIKVRYFTTLRELAGRREEELEMRGGGLLSDIIEKVSTKYGEEAFDYLHVNKKGEIDSSIQLLVNGVNAQARLQGLKTELKEGDVVAIIPPVGGG